MTPTQRQTAVQLFRDASGIPVTRLVQRGRDPETARLAIELEDGRLVKLGGAEQLISRARFDRITMVAVGKLTHPCTPAEWKQVVAMLVQHACDVEETEGEDLASRLEDWVDQYARDATVDRDGAIKHRAAFVDDGRVHVHAEHFTRWLKREYSETLAAADIRAGLAELGWEPVRFDYNAAGRGKRRQRTTARYFRGPAAGGE